MVRMGSPDGIWERIAGLLPAERGRRGRPPKPHRGGVEAIDRHEVHQPADAVKDPYVLEFVGLPESSRWLESDLEQALTDRLQQFRNDIKSLSLPLRSARLNC